MTNGYNTAMQGNSSAGNLLLGQYNAVSNAVSKAGENSVAMMGAGSAIGSMAAAI